MEAVSAFYVSVQKIVEKLNLLALRKFPKANQFYLLITTAFVVIVVIEFNVLVCV